MNDIKKQVIIVIPIYKDFLSESELLSLKQCLKILGTFDIVLVCSNDIDLSKYKLIFREYKLPIVVEYFDTMFFKSVVGYNRLMLSQSFYTRFQRYEYILIYQLDAYVFENKLTEWCNKGYDYVGAPWLWPNKKFHETCGNGGFSLRKVKTFISLLNTPLEKKIFSFKGLMCYYRYRGPLHKFKYVLLGLLGYRNSLNYFVNINPVNEDIFYSSLKYDYFSIPEAQEAMYFSFETEPSFLYEKTNNILPFGCHAWEKYEYATFWKKIIPF
ncbi:MAG: hypothetical protein E7085_01610 [Parabacteroides distasonis]|nr:hypothetical protein [Parabacteroides distasonis]